MNKGLYKVKDQSILYWYKSWKNYSENSGASVDLEVVDLWTWQNWCDDSDYLVGAACLAQW